MEMQYLVGDMNLNSPMRGRAPTDMCCCCGLITTEKQTSWSRNYLELDKQNSKHLKHMDAFKNFGNKILGNLSVL